MNNSNQENSGNVLKIMEKAAADIRRLESEAENALFESDDKQAHQDKLEQKTDILIELADKVEPYLEELSSKMENFVLGELTRYSRNANIANNLNSVFYMANLLYQEGYKDEDPNDLERLIQKIKEPAKP